MKIHPFLFKYQISFAQANNIQDKMCYTECYDTTEFFRDDFDIDGFIYYVNNFYKNTPKVNVLNYACSNGKEPYSLLLRMKMILRDKIDKYLPIKATDIDKNNIIKARIGRFKVTNNEAFKIDRSGDLNLNRYIEIVNDGVDKYAFVKDSLKNMVNFSKVNILDDLDDNPKKNTIVICRNFWSYLAGNEQIKLADLLAKNLDKSCLVVIGSFDKICGVDRLLEKRGFVNTEIDGVMKKV